MSDTATAEVSSEIKGLGDQLANLTLKQAVDLKEYLKSAYGIEPAAGGAVMMAAGPAAAAEEKEEKTSFDVVLKSFGDKKINVIKAIRELIPGLGLKEAKELVDGAPNTIKEAAGKDEAEDIKGKLEGAGATVELK